MYTVYVLQSLRTGRYYIGHTDDLRMRLTKHNRGAVRSTKPGLPWRVTHFEQYVTRSEAYRRELEIKRYKGGIQFKELIEKGLGLGRVA